MTCPLKNTYSVEGLFEKGDMPRGEAFLNKPAGPGPHLAANSEKANNATQATM